MCIRDSAIGWQQVIKRIPLTTAFANKAVTVVWGLVWGALFFREAVTPGKLLGAALDVYKRQACAPLPRIWRPSP